MIPVSSILQAPPGPPATPRSPQPRPPHPQSLRPSIPPPLGALDGRRGLERVGGIRGARRIQAVSGEGGEQRGVSRSVRHRWEYSVRAVIVELITDVGFSFQRLRLFSCSAWPCKPRPLCTCISACLCCPRSQRRRRRFLRGCSGCQFLTGGKDLFLEFSIFFT